MTVHVNPLGITTYVTAPPTENPGQGEPIPTLAHVSRGRQTTDSGPGPAADKPMAQPARSGSAGAATPTAAPRPCGPGEPIEALARKMSDVSAQLMALSNYLNDIAVILNKGPQGYYADALRERGSSSGNALDNNWTMPLIVSTLLKTSVGQPDRPAAEDNSLLPLVLGLILKTDTADEK